MSMLLKLLKWLPLNLGGLIGILQGIVKCLKEILTVVANILFPIIPGDKFKVVVAVIRNVVNKIDEILETIKSFFLQKAVD